MKVLLTGVAGFFGSHCLEYILANTDWSVIGVDSLKHKGNARRLEVARPYGERFQFIQRDLATHSLNLPRIDIIINAASDSHVDRSIENPGHTWTNNTALILTMLEIARVTKATLFVQISTDEVYGPASDGQAHAEWSPIIPSNPYSASKAAQEALCVSYWRTYGVPVVIVNAMNMIGERQDPEKYLPKIIRSLLTGQHVEVHTDAKGVPGTRFYTHAKNLASAIVFLANRPVASYPKDDRPDRWHVVGQEEIDNRELFIRIAKILGVPPRFRLVNFHDKRPGHDRRYALCGDKLASLGWVHPVPLDGALEDVVRWYAENKSWLE